ncbi:hypothetical protein ACRQ5Q_43335 (plasmid) [Bradyrhizobium sp. PMVTL-01]|uniref:hypothetical protein n=1 Tax=Bradyrhizobium sp. PMVTL-01 TaxID=3434999 RepID=UPI003F6F09DA
MGQSKPFGKFAVVVECDRDQRAAMDNLLQSGRLTVLTYDTLSKAQRALFHLGDSVEVLVVDMDLDLEAAGMEWLVRVKRRFPNLHIIVVSDDSAEIPQDVHVLPKSWQPLDLLREASRRVSYRM